MFKKAGLILSDLIRKRSRAVTASILAIIMAFSIVAIYSASTTVIIEDGDKSFKFRSSESNPKKIVELAGISLDSEDLIYVNRDSALPVLTIKRAIPVSIVSGEFKTTLKLANGTVSDALEKAGFALGEEDLVNFDLNETVTDNMVIEVEDIEYKYEIVTEEVPFETVTKYSTGLAKGQTTTTAGQNGQREVKYCVKYVNGIAVEKTVAWENIITAPVNAVKTVGTSAAISSNRVTGGTISELVPPFEIPLDANGKPINYSRVITGNATAYYNAYGRHCSTGVWPKPGYIAVNPKVIPYGTKLYIVSADGRYNYGYAIAADTGGFTTNGSGTVADLFFNTRGECISFGRRQIEIYVIG